jgi:hypothetical protein
VRYVTPRMTAIMSAIARMSATESLISITSFPGPFGLGPA